MKFRLTHVPPNPTLIYADSVQLPPRTTHIVSQGGGSTIDVGKWIARKYNLKHTAIPTTAGTGSEVTKYCVLTVDGKKTTFTDGRFIPESYVLDPRLVVSLPPDQTLSTGLDALSQALESLWSKKATPASRAYATAAIEIIVSNLWISHTEPTNERARMEMLIGANLSGRAINIAPTNICHAISYPLTDWYGIPHGLACGLTLAYFAKKALGLNLWGWLEGFKLPEFKQIDVEKVAHEVLKSEKIKDYPYEITLRDLLACYL